MTHHYDEERLGVLLRILRPAPTGWVTGGAGAAHRSTYARRDRLAGRSRPRVPRGPRRGSRRGTRGRGLRARPSAPGRDPVASSHRLNGQGLRDSGVVESRPVQDVAAHTWDASKAALPAWSLPKDAVDRIALPADWPERVTREWALGGSTGAGVRVCILDSGVDASHPMVGGLESAVVISRRRGRRGARRRGHRGRRLGPRDGLRRHRPAPRSRRAHLERPGARSRASPARAQCSSPASATRSSRASTSST